MSELELTCVVEIPKGSRNKYEYDPELGAVKLDRFISASVVYPTDYGFVPGTLAADGDPLDVLVCVSEPTFPGCVVPAKVVGLFKMADEKGTMTTSCCVPCSDPGWNHMRGRRRSAHRLLRSRSATSSPSTRTSTPTVTPRSWAGGTARRRWPSWRRRAAAIGRRRPAEPPAPVFHVELRQFPHVARAFNLSAEELHAHVISPWSSRAAARARRISAGTRAGPSSRSTRRRELAAEDLGMGRGWGTVTREGEDVTEQLLSAAQTQAEAPAELAEVKTRILAAAADRPIPLTQLIDLVGDVTWRVSERLRVAEQAVWELLHEERLALVENSAVLTRDRWQPVILSWGSWNADGTVAIQATDTA